MTQEDYVSFEVAKLLKEKGFNGLCTAYYDYFTTDEFHCGYEPTDFNSIDTKIRKIVAAPTNQMAMKWLRENHKIYINIRYVPKHFCFEFKFINKSAEDKRVVYSQIYKDALEAAIKYVLENLI